MPKNKHALIRYMAIDRCLRNPGRIWRLDELIEACDHALSEFDPGSGGVSERTVYDDLRFMESEAGYQAPIIRERHPDEARKYGYTYADRNFTIGKEPLNDQEMEQLREAMLLLTRFKGMPQFEWVEEILARLDASFDIRTGSRHAIEFEANPYLKGLEHITPVFNAIINKLVLKVTYRSFSGNPQFDLHLHPYFLKQYNNRWFAFGWNEEQEYVINLALDRMVGISGSNHTYRENETIDFSDYFEDTVGVTVNTGREPEEVVLRVGQKTWPRIETKPLHGSQRIASRTEEYVEVRYELIPNRELEALLLSYGEDIEVLQPASLRDIVAGRIARMNKRYSSRSRDDAGGQ